jgi:hypothetical protein
VTVALNGAVAVTSGSSYWLAVMSADAGLVVRDRQRGNCTAHASYNALGTFPGTWGTDNYTGTEGPPSMTLKTTGWA